MDGKRRSPMLRRIKPAPKLTIRRQRSRAVRLALLAVLFLSVGGLAWLAYALGRDGSGSRNPSSELALAMQRRIGALSAERDRMASGLNAADSQLAIERATKEKLASQLKALEIENAQLQEDLSFFENLLPAGPASQDVSIRRLTLDLPGPNQLRYRMLIMRHGKAEQDFNGNLQLLVALAGNGAPATLVFPEKDNARAEQFRLGFRHYQRIEGILELPAGSRVKSVQARVYENGKLRSQQSANL